MHNDRHEVKCTAVGPTSTFSLSRHAFTDAIEAHNVLDMKRATQSGGSGFMLERPLAMFDPKESIRLAWDICVIVPLLL